MTRAAARDLRTLGIPRERVSIVARTHDEEGVLAEAAGASPGSEIEDSVMQHVGELYEQCAVRFQWQRGDMITLDNMLVCHARDPHVGARKICVALGEMITAAEVETLAAAAHASK